MTAIHAPYRLTLAGMAIAMLAAFVVPAAAVAPRPEVLRRHAKILKSNPAANDALRTSPEAIRLWFSERVEIGISRIRLVGSTGTAFTTGKVTRIPGESAASLMAVVTTPLPAGTYTVQWIAASDDGHPMKGSYSFAVVPRT